MTSQSPTLSKSRYMAGQQCHKRLYLECFNRELADPVDPRSQARFDEGRRVGELARDLRPGGVLIEEDHLHTREAIESTARALADPNIPAIYEAAFQFEDVVIRVDILARVSPQEFDVIEVKSSTKVKPEYKPDLGIQLWVLEGAGLRIDKAILAHINNAYEYSGGEYICDHLFTLADLTSKLRASQNKYRAALTDMRESLQEAEPPAVEVGPHCRNPHDCNFLTYCKAALPEHPIQNLYRITAPQRKRLFALGVKSIPTNQASSVNLTGIQRRICKSLQTGDPFLSKNIKSRLRAWGRPLHFLDFETIAPALPIYEGTTPYLAIPFQWSLHTITRDGALEHREYLHDDTSDPRPQLTEALLNAVGSEGRVVHYTNYEATMLGRLKAAVPRSSRQLEAVKERLADLAVEIREHFYDPAMNNSFSLKDVYPALFPGEGYDELEISDGTMASRAFLEMICADTAASRRSSIRDDLLAYCRLDTEATVKMFRKLAQEL